MRQEKVLFNWVIFIYFDIDEVFYFLFLNIKKYFN